MAVQEKQSNNDRLRILVVDDERANLSLIEKTLSINGMDSAKATSGKEAMDMIRHEPFDVVLLDVMMPNLDGYEVCKILKGDEATRLIPIILVTALNEREDKIRGIESGCDDFISKPLDRTELIARVKALGKVKRLNDDLEKAEAVVMSLARAVEAKDDNTGGHCDRLIDMAREFGSFVGLGATEIKMLERVSVLHDVGKIGMPDSILLKPGKLTEENWTVMRKHPVIGEDICRPLRSLKNIGPIIRTHHERYNGSGYPDGLKGEKIPYLARVFQIIDAYDALTTKRPYKPAFSGEKTLGILKEETKNGLWDPELMKKFLEFISNNKGGKK